MDFKKIILSIFFISLLILFGILYHFREIVITALIAYVQGPMVATVSEARIKATLDLEIDGYLYCPGDIVNLTNIVQNTGNRDIIGNLHTTILNPSNSIINTTSWYAIGLYPGQVEYFNTSYVVPTDPYIGTYAANSNFTYDGRVEYETVNFKISKGSGLFVYSPAYTIEKTIEPGGFDDTTTIYMWLENPCENTTITMGKSSGIPGDWVSFTNDKIFLSTSNSTIMNISVPTNTIEGDYYGQISLSRPGFYGEEKYYINFIVHVRGLAFTLTVDTQPKKVCLGGVISAIINAEKTREGPLDVNMTYRIVNTTIPEINRTLHFDNITAQDFPTFNVPTSMAKDFYTFLAILQYNNTQVQASDIFEIIECIPAPSVSRPSVTRPELALISIRNLSLTLSTNTLTVIIGNRTSFIAFVNNTGTDTVNSVKISVEGIPLNWIETFPAISDINPGQIKEYLVSINVPKDALSDVYELNVTATDSVKSNKETLILIVGKDPKEIADLLLTELERIRELSNQSLIVEECIDVSEIKPLYQDAEMARENGLKEYYNGQFSNAIDWFKYSISNYQKVIDKVEIAVQLEISATKKSSLLILSGKNLIDQLDQAQKYLSEKKYSEICDILLKTRTQVMHGFFFWPLLIIILVITIIIFVFVRRRYKKREIARKLLEIKKTLNKANEPFS